ncbi:MAG: PQQ-dependent sugar dehydrogenase [Nitratireductor sp.]
MRTPCHAFFAAVLAVFVAPHASAESFKTEKAEIEVTTIATGLDHPWGMAMLPDGSLLVTERAGRMLHVENAGKDSVVTALSGVPQVAARGQGGLLDIVVDEDFANSRRLWFTWSERGQGGFSTALSTATLSADNSALENVEKIFVMARKTTTGHHFGSRIVLAPDGKLFMTMGERGEAMRAQDFFDHAGSVIRLNRDGSVPADNPFADGGKGLPEIWSKGHRNPQGAAWSNSENRLWTVEHGAKGGDEINRPEPGRNYGWPVISYGVNYDGSTVGIGSEAPGYEQPVHYWDPSIAPSGMAFYDGNLFPQWRGNLFVGALKYQMLVRLEVDKGKVLAQEPMLQGEFGRIRDVRSFADGAIWMLTDEDDGKLLRITPVARK